MKNKGHLHKKISISLSEWDLKHLDFLCNEMITNRSSVIQYCLAAAFNFYCFDEGSRSQILYKRAYEEFFTNEAQIEEYRNIKTEEEVMRKWREKVNKIHSDKLLSRESKKDID